MEGGNKRQGKDFELLEYHPKGADLFTAPKDDGGRVYKGPTKWGVKVLYDPPLSGDNVGIQMWDI